MTLGDICVHSLFSDQDNDLWLLK